jgi:hypothetical protein
MIECPECTGEMVPVTYECTPSDYVYRDDEGSILGVYYESHGLPLDDPEIGSTERGRYCVECKRYTEE